MNLFFAGVTVCMLVAYAIIIVVLPWKGSIMPQAKVHYRAVTLVGTVIADGRTLSPPSPGDWLTINGKKYVVSSREWETAGEFLGTESLAAWGHLPSDLVCVTLTLAFMSNVTGGKPK